MAIKVEHKKQDTVITLWDNWHSKMQTFDLTKVIRININMPDHEASICGASVELKYGRTFYITKADYRELKAQLDNCTYMKENNVTIDYLKRDKDVETGGNTITLKSIKGEVYEIDKSNILELTDYTDVDDRDVYDIEFVEVNEDTHHKHIKLIAVNENQYNEVRDYLDNKGLLEKIKGESSIIKNLYKVKYIPKTTYYFEDN